MIHIAITKGRLEKEIANILTEGGYTGDRLLSKDRSLIIHDGNEEITYYPAKEVVGIKQPVVVLLNMIDVAKSQGHLLSGVLSA